MKGHLQAGALAMGIELDQIALARFARFAEMMAEWNARMNLTRIPPCDVVPLHCLDSLALLVAVEPPLGSRLIDVGAGAGLPGLAVKIARPDLRVSLLDATRKRVDFARAAVQELGLDDVECIHGRAEDLARTPQHRAGYSVAAARAVARMNVLVEWLAPFARVGGLIVALKSEAVDAELEQARPAIARLGAEMVRVVPVTLPGVDIRRKLIVLRQARPAPPAFPRPASETKRHPL